MARCRRIAAPERVRIVPCSNARTNSTRLSVPMLSFSQQRGLGSQRFTPRGRGRTHARRADHTGTAVRPGSFCCVCIASAPAAAEARTICLSAMRAAMTLEVFKVFCGGCPSHRFLFNDESSDSDGGHGRGGDGCRKREQVDIVIWARAHQRRAYPSGTSPPGRVSAEHTGGGGAGWNPRCLESPPLPRPARARATRAEWYAWMDACAPALRAAHVAAEVVHARVHACSTRAVQLARAVVAAHVGALPSRSPHTDQRLRPHTFGVLAVCLWPTHAHNLGADGSPWG